MSLMKSNDKDASLEQEGHFVPSSMCDKVAFMGITNDKYIYEETTTALKNSKVLLDIYKYIEVVGYQIDQFMFDKFWQSVSKSSCVVILTAVIDWLGYDSMEERFNKASFIDLLKSHEIQFKHIKHTDPEFENYPELVDDAKTMTVAALKSKKWIIIDSDDFKRMVMCLRTKKAEQIRDYYISLEKLFKMYCEYTTHFLQQQIKAIDKDLHTARDVVAPPAPHESQKHCFTIFEMSPSYVPFESDPKYIRVNKPNVIIGRCQNKSLKSCFKAIRRYGGGSNQNT